MNNVISFYERQSGNYNGKNYDSTLGRLCVHENDSWKGIAPSTEAADFNPEPPIFTAKFAKCENHSHILALANEDGKIALQNTNLRSTQPESERTLAGQQCHFNAVFDLEWMPGHMKFISASGDHTARLWEVRDSNFENSRVFNGHTRSVKTAAFRKTDSAVFATGGRDGAILIWDTRAAVNVGSMPRADNCIYSGHTGGPGTPQSCKRRTRQTPKLTPNVASSSITGLVFQDDNTLVSCGAGDGIVKVWDLRRNYTSYKKEPLPKHSLPYPGTSTFKGYTNLMVDNSGLKLYVNCMDNYIYCYNLATYSSVPLIKYVGLRNSTFYIKSSLSPDGQYLLSGSSDEKAYIWNINNSQPLVVLVGHTVEVTCVAWSQANDMRLVTCSDDARHKIWRIGSELINDDEQINYRGRTEICKEYKSINQLRVRLKALENTPRSIKRLVEQNETTPSSTEKLNGKRSFAEMMMSGGGGVSGGGGGGGVGSSSSGVGCSHNLLSNKNNHFGGSGQKRPHIEPKGRRLFSPSTSSSASYSNTISSSNAFFNGLASILETNETTSLGISFTSPPITPTSINQSPISSSNNYFHSFKPNVSKLMFSPPQPDKIQINIKSPDKTPPQQPLLRPTTTSRLVCTSSSSSSSSSLSPPSSHLTTTETFYSPTLNLPNFVVNGEAPHLQLQSPKRKLKENVDWLTKIRKQKLLSTINSQLNDKLNGIHNLTQPTREHLINETISSSSMNRLNYDVCVSPRVQSLKSHEFNTHNQISSNISPAAVGAAASTTNSRYQLSCMSSTAAAALSPKRRSSVSGPNDSTTNTIQTNSFNQQKTPNGRRNSETTILRFFSIKSQTTTNNNNNNINHGTQNTSESPVTNTNQ